MGQPLRRPFSYAGDLWVCVGISPGPIADAYRFAHPPTFNGTPTTYGQKVRLNGGDDPRADPMGFYHGMMVRSGGEDLVLCGPPTRFVAGRVSQLSLFGCPQGDAN